MCPDNVVTYVFAVYGCEVRIRSEHTCKQELDTRCSSSDLQLGVCRDVTKCPKTKYFKNHSKIQPLSYYSDRINCKHPSQQERNYYVPESACYRNDRGKNCLLLFLNTLALENGIYCGIQHCGSNIRENETKVEMLTTEIVCISTFILINSSKKYVYTPEILCLFNIATYHWYILIAVKVLHSDGECNGLKRGSTAKQNGVSGFLCLGSNSFNSALAKPS
jgi:hypothetical protein